MTPDCCQAQLDLYPDTAGIWVCPECETVWTESEDDPEWHWVSSHVCREREMETA